jgi:hypothetical protein
MANDGWCARVASSHCLRLRAGASAIGRRRSVAKDASCPRAGLGSRTPGPAVRLAFDAAAHASCPGLLHIALCSTRRPAFGSRLGAPFASGWGTAGGGSAPSRPAAPSTAPAPHWGGNIRTAKRQRTLQSSLSTSRWLAAVVRMLTIAAGPGGRHRPQPERAGAPSDPGCTHPRLPLHGVPSTRPYNRHCLPIDGNGRVGSSKV